MSDTLNNSVELSIKRSSVKTRQSQLQEYREKAKEFSMSNAGNKNHLNQLKAEIKDLEDELKQLNVSIARMNEAEIDFRVMDQHKMGYRRY